MRKPGMIDGRKMTDRRVALADIRETFTDRAEDIMFQICQLQEDYRAACQSAAIDSSTESIELAAAVDAMMQFIEAYNSGSMPMYADYQPGDVNRMADSIREYAERVENARLYRIVWNAKQHQIPPRPGGNKETKNADNDSKTDR